MTATLLVRIKKKVLAGNILLAGLTILSYLSRVVDPDTFGWIAMLGLVYTAMIVGHTIMVIGWLIIGPRKYMLVSLLFLMLEVCYFNNWIQLSVAQSDIPESALTIGTLNLQFGKVLATLPTEQHDRYRKLATQLEKLDVLCVQEHGNFNERYISFPYQYLLPDQHVGIYSNYPIIDSGSVLSSFNSANNCVWADILYLDDTIRVYSAHLESNRHDGVIPHEVDQVKAEIRTASGYLGLLKHYIRFSSMRSEQSIDVKKHQSTIHHPSIIAGDFNDVPLSAMYHNMSAGLKDTFIEKGLGSGNTLRTLIPGLRIDYILASSEWQVFDHDIAKETYSDHFLVVAKLGL